MVQKGTQYEHIQYIQHAEYANFHS